MRFMPLIYLVFVAAGAAIAAIVAPVYVDLLRRELSRAQEIEKVAIGLGLRFSRMDPTYLRSTADRYPLSLYLRGVEQTYENFLVGTMQSVALMSFDMLYRHRV